MFDVIKKYKWIIAVLGATALILTIICAISTNNEEDIPDNKGVSINAGDDNKDNNADFNGQDGQTTTQPTKVEDSSVDNDFDTLIEKKGSILGEWTDSQGARFDCFSHGENSIYANIELVDTGNYWSGTVDTDNTTYIKLSDENTGSAIDIEILGSMDSSELGLDNGQIYLELKFPGEETSRLFRRANEDYLDESVKEILKQEGDGVSGGSPDDEQYINEGEEVQVIEDEESSENDNAEDEPIDEQPIEE